MLAVKRFNRSLVVAEKYPVVILIVNLLHWQLEQRSKMIPHFYFKRLMV